MTDYIIIDSIDSLSKYIRATKPPLNHLNEVIWNLGIKAIIIEEANPETYCLQIKDYWGKWSDIVERPLFIILFNGLVFIDR
jgi:hypothetical protein